MREYRYDVWSNLKYIGFPDDMLRYDQARIISQYEGADRTVYVIQGKTRPTIGRWASFMYTVGKVEVV